MSPDIQLKHEAAVCRSWTALAGGACGEESIYESYLRQLNNIHCLGKPEGIWVLAVSLEKVITVPHPVCALVPV